MTEIILAHLADAGTDFSDYTVALKKVFAFIVKFRPKSRIFFTDYHAPSRLSGPTGKAVEVFDRVNKTSRACSKHNAWLAGCNSFRRDQNGYDGHGRDPKCQQHRSTSGKAPAIACIGDRFLVRRVPCCQCRC